MVSLPASAAGPLAWPAVTREARPWSYWWWLASAVDRANLTRELERYQRAGWGGVHIIPIYGAKGYEARSIDYLSPQWMEMLNHSVAEAGRLGMGVDMTLGTGWCFGGPEVTEREASAQAVFKTWDLAAGQRLPERLDSAAFQAVAAFSPDGQMVELTGRPDWTPPSGTWRVCAVTQRPTSRVKRAAPGGQGYMLNPFYGEAIRHYLVRFTRAFDGYQGPKPRSIYHDSFEYGVDWSPDLFEQFERRRGYRLETELPALMDKAGDRAARVKSDYRETLSDAMIETFAPAWVNWARERGIRTRNQAHGSPGNLLDLYAAADIPETEMFNRDRSTLVSKLASSAAHVTGRNLVASETGTWLKEHFNETLADLKDLLDQLYLSGVNHIFYHGTCYSPDEAPWPGWLFYASTEMNPRNSIWRDVPALNTYIARCQSMLQAGRPAADILLYWPIYDVWHDPAGMAIKMTVHTRQWIEGQRAGALGNQLLKRGFTFDFISDRQLAQASAAAGEVAVAGGTYRALLIPSTAHMPVATMENLLRLARGGATVIFEDGPPADVPGWNNLDSRRAALRKLVEAMPLAKTAAGRVFAGDVEAALQAAGIRREPMTDHEGLQFIRRATDGGRVYFIANRGRQPVEGWVPLAATARSAGLMDPMTGHTGRAALRRAAAGSEVFLALEPGDSIFLRTFSTQAIAGPAWGYRKPGDAATPVAGPWQVRFIAGGPELPTPIHAARLASWTTLGESAERFAGTAVYSAVFDAPAGAASWFLELGKVCESARVRLNGRDLGTVFVAPYRVMAGSLKPRANLLEVEVTNLAANRIRDLDRRKVSWKVFHDINFASMSYKPFDASTWPLRDSGLLGPVVLRPAVTIRTAVPPDPAGPGK